MRPSEEAVREQARAAAGAGDDEVRLRDRLLEALRADGLDAVAAGEAELAARGRVDLDALGAAAQQLGDAEARVGAGADHERPAPVHAAELRGRAVDRDGGAGATGRADRRLGGDALRAAERVLEEVVQERGGVTGAAGGLVGGAHLPGDLRLAEDDGAQPRGDLVEVAGDRVAHRGLEAEGDDLAVQARGAGDGVDHEIHAVVEAHGVEVDLEAVAGGDDGPSLERPARGVELRDAGGKGLRVLCEGVEHIEIEVLVGGAEGSEHGRSLGPRPGSGAPGSTLAPTCAQ